ncbi:DUF7064 domain-containing protein [Nocardia alni]|uniref:DUF7064 domain-containing protein n=1 Tax=Nocardia alni TaxID=2815723 RepID=UPI001C240AFF|nr:hypothetical protein [Nocardia alni]
MTSTLTAHPDYRRHNLGDDPLGRESLLFLFQLPAERIGLAFYTWVTSDHKTGYAAWVYGGNSDGSAIFEHRDGASVDPNADFDAWQAFDLTINHSPDQLVTSVKFAGDSFQADLEFTPFHDAYLYSSHPLGCPPFFATDRLEQSGTYRGTLQFAGREITVDTSGHHDHSWGIRDWESIQHYKWFETTTDTTAVHILDIYGLGERTTMGYVHKEGITSPVESAKWDVEYNAQNFQTSTRVDVIDEAGRSTSVTCDPYAYFEFPVSPRTTLLDVVVRAEIDGNAGSGFADWAWPKDYLSHLREREQ